MANNIYLNCPPLMSDARHISDYNPRCMQEYQLTDPNGHAVTSYAYRQYLINNAASLISNIQSDMITRFGCGGGCAFVSYPPAQNVQTCDTHACTILPSQARLGLGLETNYLQASPDDVLLASPTAGIDHPSQIQYDEPIDADTRRWQYMAPSLPFVGPQLETTNHVPVPAP